MEITITLSCFVFAIFGLILMITLIVLVGRLYRRPTLKDFANGRRRVLVTGTDTGFGRELALTLANQLGITVYAGCLTEEGEQNLRADASSADRLKTIRLDVTDPVSVDKARRYIEDELCDAGIDGLWGLVNNAGITRGHMFHYATLDDYRAVMEVNFFGTVRMTEAFLPLITKCRGRIVNMISIISRCSSTAEPYACSKYALQPYTDGLRRYLNTFGGHAATIEPGFFKTKILDVNIITADLDRMWTEMTPEKRHLYGPEFHDAAKTAVAEMSSRMPFASLNRISMVVDSMVHALSAQRPKSRYVIGMDARFICIPMGYMPDWYIDFACRQVMPLHSVLARRLKAQRRLQQPSTTSISGSKSNCPPLLASSNRKEL